MLLKLLSLVPHSSFPFGMPLPVFSIFFPLPLLSSLASSIYVAEKKLSRFWIVSIDEQMLLVRVGSEIVVVANISPSIFPPGFGSPASAFVQSNSRSFPSLTFFYSAASSSITSFSFISVLNPNLILTIVYRKQNQSDKCQTILLPKNTAMNSSVTKEESVSERCSRPSSEKQVEYRLNSGYKE
jgi:hypothetical protein